ncbi:MAG: Nudix family hydrolase [Gammaproteobacteria bacterium]|nr:Nudix family hydrolase [Gammaproteobacteria bacterium]
MSRYVQVAVAVITNQNNEVLIACRPASAHQGGLWEFPGGKLEPDESVLDALEREIKEELDIDVQQFSPLIKIRHQYTDKSVLLDVWRVTSFHGIPRGVEGQPIKWVKIPDLININFPEADMPIIAALQLPDEYMITGSFTDHGDFSAKLKSSIDRGEKIVQLRCKDMATDDYLKVAEIAGAICQEKKAILLLNTSADVFAKTNADGLHLNSRALFEYDKRPIADNKLLSVSCHNQQEMQQAVRLGADILLLSPVRETTSHPGVPGIGWHAFADMVATVNCPVYALGGMTGKDKDEARQHGAQGIAAISSLWSDAS